MPSYQPVDVFVKNKLDPNDPVTDVQVRVYDEDGAVFYSQAVTDGSGKASFLLYTQKYTLRFYKFQVGFTQPQVIEVLEGTNGQTAQNQFDVEAELLVPPIAPDPQLCRASGYFRDITGRPFRNLELLFVGQFAPILLQDQGVIPERRMTRTNTEGYTCIDLIRCAKYWVTIEGQEDEQRSISVPDAASVNLPDLLYPVVQSVSFSPVAPYSVRVGESLTLTPTVVATNHVPLDGVAPCDLNWSLSDEDVASLTTNADTLVITGRSIGTTELTAVRRDQSVVILPYPAIQGVPISVSVTY